MSNVLLYSDDAQLREHVRLALGRRPAPDLDPITFLEAEDGPSVVALVDQGGIDLVVLDGEAWPTGGMGISRQLKNEVRDCPAVVLLIARRDDRWLATWSLADAVVPLPLDAVAITDVVVRLLRARAHRPALPSGRRGVLGLR